MFYLSLSKAMKVMEKLDPTAENEFSLMWSINHENILKYYEHFDHEIRGEAKTCVITEYCQVCFNQTFISIFLPKFGLLLNCFKERRF